MVAIKDALEGKHHIVCIQFAGGGTVRSLKLYVTTQMEAVGCAVIQHLPAFSQLRHQSIGVGSTSSSRSYNWAANVSTMRPLLVLRVERIDLPADAIDKPTVTDISVRSLLRRSSSLTTQKSSHHDQR